METNLLENKLLSGVDKIFERRVEHKLELLHDAREVGGDNVLRAILAEVDKSSTSMSRNARARGLNKGFQKSWDHLNKFKFNSW